MSADTKGYTCVARYERWMIVDRFGVRAPNVPVFERYADARRHADDLNDAVNAARFA